MKALRTIHQYNPNRNSEFSISIQVRSMLKESDRRRAVTLDVTGFTMPAVDAMMLTSIEAHAVGNLAVAAEGFAAVIAAAPDFSEAWYNAGLVAFQSGNTWQAIDSIHRAISIQAEPAYLTDLAAIYQFVGENCVAEQLLADAIEIDDGYSAAHFHRGVVLAGQDRFDEALFHLHRALELNYSHDVTLQEMGLLFERVGDMTSAIRSYETALGLNPHLHVCLERLCHHSLVGICQLTGEQARQAMELGSVWFDCPSHQERAAKLMVAAELA